MGDGAGRRARLSSVTMTKQDERHGPGLPEGGLGRTSVGLVAEQLARADDAARRLLARGPSALTLGISRRGALAHVRCFGTTQYGGDEPVTDRSLFAVASVTKPIAATAVMLLIERGHFGLDTPVAA